MRELLRKLTEAYGPSGHEEGVAEIIKKEVEGLVDEIRTDRVGNLIAVKHGGGKKLMFAAHMDEIGVIVTHIDDNGFLRFSQIGGLSPTRLIAQRVIFQNGTIGTISHDKLDLIKDLKLSKMYIDIGAKDKEDAAAKVKIGDAASFYRNLDDLGDRVIAKALDNRSGCAMLIQAIRDLGKTPNKVYCVFTVQEELGIRGARVSAFGIDPDVGIAVDVTGTGDTPKSDPMDVELGKGPTVKIKDSSVMTSPKVKDLMIRIAEREGIPYQREILVAGGTDAGAMQLTREGVPAGAVSIPCRYIHSPSEMVSMSDLENGARLLAKIAEEPIDF